MAFASGSGVRVAVVKEETFGVTPPAPSFETIRVTSGGMRTTKATGTSNERQPDRNVRDEFMLGKDATGSYQAEMSYGSFDTLLEMALFGDWTDDVLKNGVTRHSLTVEETRTIGAAESYSRFRGVMLNTISLAIAARAVVTVSLDVMGIEETLAEAPVADATYADPLTTPVSTSSANIAQLNVDGVVPAPKISNMSLQLANNLRTRPVVGSPLSEEFGEGRCEVTGSIECYFQSNALYQKVLDHGSGALSFVIGNAPGAGYRITLPKIIFGDGEVTAGGNDDDVMVNIPIRAVLESAEGCSIKIERGV
ncbi:phage tail tube protein [Aureimonas mangrovi]|uniref:phage tail tube protein n=1 Tax=Aureimonas mangrovi TaxID=2758041 RepID=UPI00163DB256|nr:phage tail tube protein [Aureimonas mangrovi]